MKEAALPRLLFAFATGHRASATIISFFHRSVSVPMKGRTIDEKCKCNILRTHRRVAPPRAIDGNLIIYLCAYLQHALRDALNTLYARCMSRRLNDMPICFFVIFDAINTLRRTLAIASVNELMLECVAAMLSKINVGDAMKGSK